MLAFMVEDIGFQPRNLSGDRSAVSLGGWR